MASLLTEPLFETSGRGHPSSFYHFAVTKSEVIWRWWKISPRVVDRLSKPGELKEPHRDFLDDRMLQREVSMVFGQGILEYTMSLCQGHYDYLERLSDTLLLRIVKHLEIEDIGQLGRTSRRFHKLCGSEELWEQVVQQRFSTVSAEVASLALDVGWRSIFFTSKLQLQKLINRKRLKKAKKRQARQVSDTDAKAEQSHDDTSEANPTPGCAAGPHFGGIPDLCLGTDLGTRIDTSSSCDIDPNPESVAASDSSVPTG
nr:LOW QUALITY PROTEIN: F-box only protein 36b [Gasterosteus aculeatus aculeatus]